MTGWWWPREVCYAGVFDADKKASSIAALEKSNAADTSNCQELENDVDESDSESDDGYKAMLEGAMMDGREANRLVADQYCGFFVGLVSHLARDR